MQLSPRRLTQVTTADVAELHEPELEALLVQPENAFDLADVALEPLADPSPAVAIARFDAAAADARRALVETTDARLLEIWTLRKEGHDLVSAPRIVALRTEGLYHLVHHRGQLTVYLRLLNVPLPPIYGPTADEGRL